MSCKFVCLGIVLRIGNCVFGFGDFLIKLIGFVTLVTSIYFGCFWLF